FTYSPDGKVIACGMSSNEVLFREASTGKPLDRVAFKSPTPGGWSSGATSLISFSPDGRLLAAGGTVGVRVWDFPCRKHLYWFNPGEGPGSPQGAKGFAFSPDGRILAAAGNEILDLRNASTGEAILKLVQPG